MEIVRRHSDYAVRMLLCLAADEDRVISCGELARSSDLPKPFAYKILRKLVSAGMISARDGRAGGFRLRKKPEKVCLYHVIKAIQGPLVVSQCVVDAKACKRRRTCPVSPKWCELQKTIIAFLEGVTLRDLLAAHQKTPGGNRKKRVTASRRPSTGRKKFDSATRKRNGRKR